MKIEDNVCRLDLAMKLKELGVRQDSLFQWRQWYMDGERDGCYFVSMDYEAQANTICSAFTVAELGEMLPNRINKNIIFSGRMDSRTWFCGCYGYGPSKTLFEFSDSSEANARAKMLIYLIENNFNFLEVVKNGNRIIREK